MGASWVADAAGWVRPELDEGREGGAGAEREGAAVWDG